MKLPRWQRQLRRPRFYAVVLAAVDCGDDGEGDGVGGGVDCGHVVALAEKGGGCWCCGC